MEIEVLKTFGVLFFLIGIILVFFAQVYVQNSHNKKLHSILNEVLKLQNNLINKLSDQKTIVLIKDKETGIVELRAISTVSKELGN